jgi:hypothetical protein
MTTQPIVALDPLASNPWRDAVSSQMIPAAVHVIRLVGMQFLRPPLRSPRLASDRRQGIDQHLEYHRVVPVGTGHTVRQRNSVAVGDQMPFAAEFSAIGRVRAGVRAPRGAATLAASKLARLKSSFPVRRSSASNT